jgi:hypothetical protein
MPLIFTGIPEGHTQHEAWVAGGRPSLKDLPTAKAGDMEFPYMELVKGSSRTDEILLSAWCKANGFPIEYFDWTDAELTKAYFEAHPEEIPATMGEQAELVARTITSDERPSHCRGRRSQLGRRREWQSAGHEGRWSGEGCGGSRRPCGAWQGDGR